MVFIGIAELCVVAFVLVAVRLVERTQEVRLLALVFRGSETELRRAQSLAVYCGESLRCLSLLGHCAQVKHILCLGKEILAIAAVGTNERTFGLLGVLAEASVEHTHGGVEHILLYQVGHVALHRVGSGLVLEHQLYDIHALLLVLVYHYDGAGIVRHRHRLHLGRVFRHHDSAEQLLNLPFHLVKVNVANHDYSLIVGTIPFLVVVLQHFRFERVDYLHLAYGHTLAVLAARIESRQVALKHTHDGAGAQSPLLVYHAALLVYLLRVERQSVRPVVEYEQARVDSSAAVCGHVGYVVYRLVDACVGIEVSAKLHADRFAVAQQVIALEMLCAVEAHVLKKVRQTALVVVLLKRTHALGDVKLRPVFRPVVVAQIVSQSVGQVPNPHILVNWHRRKHLCRQNGCDKQCHKAHHQFFQSHKQVAFCMYFHVKLYVSPRQNAYIPYWYCMCP